MDSSGNENQWSYSDAVNLKTYAEDANKRTEWALESLEIAIGGSASFKAKNYQYAIEYIKMAKNHLTKMKTLADGKAELPLTGGNHATLQEKINHAIELCNEIVVLIITTNNYSTYENKINSVVLQLDIECLNLQTLGIELIGKFS